MDENRGETAWVIHCNDIDIYTWGSLTTTSLVATAYISELTGLYAILELLSTVWRLYQLQKGEVDIICYNGWNFYKAT